MKAFGLALLALFGLVMASTAWAQTPPDAAGAAAPVEHHIAQGMELFKSKGNCGSCHGWAADGQGDPHSAGNAPSLRATQLTRDQIVEVISCGRPGTSMPHFNAYAYTDDPCYGLKQGDVGWDMPHDPPRPLQPREIQAIADYLEAKIVGKGPPTKAECTAYFGETSRCDAYPEK